MSIQDYIVSNKGKLITFKHNGNLISKIVVDICGEYFTGKNNESDARVVGVYYFSDCEIQDTSFENIKKVLSTYKNVIITTSSKLYPITVKQVNNTNVLGNFLNLDVTILFNDIVNILTIKNNSWEFLFEKDSSDKLMRLYHKNDKVKSEYYVNNNGKRNGKYIQWYENGNKNTECFYKDGNLEGEYKQWWYNGNKRTEYSYKDGNLEGEYKQFNINGILMSTCNYKDNKKNGECITWNGKNFYKGFYIDNVLQKDTIKLTNTEHGSDVTSEARENTIVTSDRTIDVPLASEMKFPNRKNKYIQTFYYTNSNPNKLRTVEVESQDNIYLNGTEIDGKRTCYKSFKKCFINYVQPTKNESSSSESFSTEHGSDTNLNSNKINSKKIVSFYYSKSNPNKLRNIEVTDENEFYLCGIETNGKRTCYKKFIKRFIHYTSNQPQQSLEKKSEIPDTIPVSSPISSEKKFPNRKYKIDYKYVTTNEIVSYTADKYIFESYLVKSYENETTENNDQAPLGSETKFPNRKEIEIYIKKDETIYNKYIEYPNNISNNIILFLYKDEEDRIEMRNIFNYFKDNITLLISKSIETKILLFDKLSNSCEYICKYEICGNSDDIYKKIFEICGKNDLCQHYYNLLLELRKLFYNNKNIPKKLQNKLYLSCYVDKISTVNSLYDEIKNYISKNLFCKIFRPYAVGDFTSNELKIIEDTILKFLNITLNFLIKKQELTKNNLEQHIKLCQSIINKISDRTKFNETRRKSPRSDSTNSFNLENLTDFPKEVREECKVSRIVSEGDELKECVNKLNVRIKYKGQIKTVDILSEYESNGKMYTVIRDLTDKCKTKTLFTNLIEFVIVSDGNYVVVPPNQK